MCKMALNKKKKKKKVRVRKSFLVRKNEYNEYLSQQQSTES